MALAAPALDVIGLTTVGGNVSLARTTRNALALLEYAGRSSVPVARGSARPIHGHYPYAHGVHGASGLTRRLPNPQVRLANSSAVDFLANQLGLFPGRITLVALGPLTNLARLIMQHPQSLHQAAGLIVMGGTVNVPGNVTPHAEFNFYSDPAAAGMVLSSGAPITLVDLAACRQVMMAREDAGRLRSDTSLGKLASQLLANWFRRDRGRDRFAFYDPLALAVAIDPKVVATHGMTLTVETDQGERLGAATVSEGGSMVKVAQEVDARRFFELFEELLGLRGLPGRGT